MGTLNILMSIHAAISLAILLGAGHPNARGNECRTNALCAAGDSSARPGENDAGVSKDLSLVAANGVWIGGTWRSHKLEYGDFLEWKGKVQIELLAASPERIKLFLITGDEKRVRAPDSEGS